MSDIKTYWGNEPSDVDNSQWKPNRVDPNGLIVTYQEKYGNLITEECIGVWENDTQWLLTWLDKESVTLQKDNINSFKIESKEHN